MRETNKAKRVSLYFSFFLKKRGTYYNIYSTLLIQILAIDEKMYTFS